MRCTTRRRCSRASAPTAAGSSGAASIPSGCSPRAPRIDMPIPWTVDQLEAAKQEVLAAAGLLGRLRPRHRLARRRPRHGRLGDAKPGQRRHRGLGMGRLLRRGQDRRREARHLPLEASVARNDPGTRQGIRALHDLHHVQACRRGEGLLGQPDDGLSRLRRRGDRRQHLLRQGRRGPHAPAGLLPQRPDPADRCRASSTTARSRCTSGTSCPTNSRASSNAG